MKTITLAFFFLFATAQASTCTKEVNAVFVNENSTAEPFKTSENHSRWTALEKRMIHTFLATDYEGNVLTLAEALDQFADKHEWSNGKPGSNAGSISYYRINGRVLAQVHYWPGDNEFGAIYEIKGTNHFKHLAAIVDSDIECE